LSASIDSPDTSDQLFQPGNQVGRYRLLGPLAAGGMAHIWAARNDQNRFARTIVLKVIRSEFAADDEYRRMLVDEATAAAAIHHPNICEIFELGSHENALFLAMEWVAGDSLSGVLKEGSPKYLPLPLAARVIANACSGLHAAHEAIGPDGQPLNIVHRDVSPQNILMSVSGQVKVSDFGIAKARDQLHSKTRTGNIKGKFAYIPPEQVRGGAVERRADIYAMGAVLYVTATGVRPFGSGAQSALSKIIRGEFPRPHEILPDFDPDFERIILKAMAYKPEDRYQTADEMRAALERWLGQRGEVLTETDIARAVKTRLSPNAMARIKALRTSPEALQRLAQEQASAAATTETGVDFSPAPTNSRSAASPRHEAPRPELRKPTSLAPQAPSLSPPTNRYGRPAQASGPDQTPTHRPPPRQEPPPKDESKPRWFERLSGKR
jgi:serine/threonine protein kinase